MKCCIIPKKFQETTIGVLSSNKNHFNIIQPHFQLTISKFPVWIHDLWCFSLSNGLSESCGTSAQGAQKDTRASQSRKQSRTNAAGKRHFAHFQNIKTSRREQWEIKTYYNTENCNLLSNNLSDFWYFFSASERPKCLNVSGQDGAFHEPKRGNRKNEVERPSCWKRELIRSNHDILIKSKIPWSHLHIKIW